jgi:hypothetical protein
MNHVMLSSVLLSGRRVSPATPDTQRALNFPSNGDAGAGNAFIAFQFLNPHTDGLPFYGPADAGVTYIWEIKPRQQAGYYVTWWWSHNGSFTWNAGNSDTYIGGHPYPRGGGIGTTVHDWEIAGMETGTDTILTLSGAAKEVVKDVWYTQAIRLNGSTKNARFYLDLPSTANGDIISKDRVGTFGDTAPPSPALTFGDSPWWADYQHERLSGLLRRVKVFNTLLSEADTLSEAADMSQLVTSAGQAAIWFGKTNYVQDDITNGPLCDYGTARRGTWAEATKATLETV